MTKDDKDISISRAVGQFFGHLWGATTKPVPRDEHTEEAQGESQAHEVGRETREDQGEVDGKKVVLRRTTIDEIEIKEDEPDR